MIRLFAIQVILGSGIMTCLIALTILEIAKANFDLEHGINPTVEGIEEKCGDGIEGISKEEAMIAMDKVVRPLYAFL